MYAQYLFTVEKRYADGVAILENLNASPLDIIELYPDFADSVDTDSGEEEAFSASDL
jgi:hypothetical protein